LACGIDPDKATIFVQSKIPQHLELFFAFSVITPLGLLERCPTYKEQMREIKNRDLNTYGFLGYPVLQAADILLYKAEVVPVGEDQLPHLELTRQIARKFNHIYKSAVFPDPKALLTKEARLPGLDGRKMSKSYNNFIALADEPETIRKKIGSMFTDPKRIHVSDPGHPEGCNVHSYYSVFKAERGKEMSQLCRQAQIGCTACKKELAEHIIEFLGPIQEKRRELLKKKNYIYDILEAGQKKAALAAETTMVEVRKLLTI
jgi:tryptophanyl-tRNA synthetase